MTIEQIIRKATEGGYPSTWKDASGWPGNNHGLIKPKDCFLDPAFWQSLGKAMGWKDMTTWEEAVSPQWKRNWHRFIDHLAEGKKAEEFFETLK